MGILHFEGRYLNRDYQLAAEFYRRGAEQGDAVAQRNLSSMYRLGQGVEQDDRQAFIWAQKSALQGYGPAQLNLGYAYRFGQGTSKNLVKAMQWYVLSKFEGQAAAEFNLRKVAPALSPEQRAEARFLADQCVSSNFSNCD